MKQIVVTAAYNDGGCSWCWQLHKIHEDYRTDCTLAGGRAVIEKVDVHDLLMLFISLGETGILAHKKMPTTIVVAEPTARALVRCALARKVHIALECGPRF